MPALVADLRERAPGVRLRVNEGASERLFTELVDGELAQAVVTEPVNDRRLVVDHLLEEDLIGLVGRDVDLPREPVPLAVFARLPLVLPPEPNPLRNEVDAAAEAAGISLTVPVEVEGIRLIADLVVAGGYASILPETAIPPELEQARTVTHLRPSAPTPRDRRARAMRSCRSPTRRCVRACTASSRSTWRRVRARPGRYGRGRRGGSHGSGCGTRQRSEGQRQADRCSGMLGAILVLFALLNTHEVGVDWVFNTWSAPLILVIAISAVIGFAMGFLVRGHLANRNDDRSHWDRVGTTGAPRPAWVKIRAAT